MWANLQLENGDRLIGDGCIDPCAMSKSGDIAVVYPINKYFIFSYLWAFKVTYQQ